MSTERTFSIIKPDAVERNKIGEITAMLENAGLRVVASKRLKLDQAKASQFYEVHKERPFFQSLCFYVFRANCSSGSRRGRCCKKK